MNFKTYRRGDAAAYQAWLGQQTPEVAQTAAMFRPWEVYQMQGRDIWVQVVDYDPSGELLQVQRRDGMVYVVVPGQIDLYAARAEDVPPDTLPGND